jgi:uncharacterized BrkB/YihY/UPF0761 family membrane protein
MATPVQRLDAFQRRRPVLGFPLAVVYKFFDDQSNYLAATITYYAFLAIFPILLTATSVLGFVLQGNVELRDELLDSAFSQFPVVGTQLGRPEGVQGSVSALVVGALTALYGISGLGQATQNAVYVAWGTARQRQLNPLLSRVRTLGLAMVGGLGVLAVSVLSVVANQLDLLGPALGQLVLLVASVATTAGVVAVLMWLAMGRRLPLRVQLPGALVVALLWQLLQWAGGVYVGAVVNRASEMNAVFAVVLGLVALLYVGAVMGMLGLQVTVVRAEHLYPRALLTPFTDAVELTEADRRAYTMYVQAQRHKGFERVSVRFDAES